MLNGSTIKLETGVYMCVPMCIYMHNYTRTYLRYLGTDLPTCLLTCVHVQSCIQLGSCQNHRPFDYRGLNNENRVLGVYSIPLKGPCSQIDILWPQSTQIGTTFMAKAHLFGYMDP